MSTINARGGNVVNGAVDIILDSDAELSQLPTFTKKGIVDGVEKNYLGVGSTAFCPKTKKAWMLDKNGWQPLN